MIFPLKILSLDIDLWWWPQEEKLAKTVVSSTGTVWQGKFSSVGHVRGAQRWTFQSEIARSLRIEAETEKSGVSRDLLKCAFTRVFEGMDNSNSSWVCRTQTLRSMCLWGLMLWRTLVRSLNGLVSLRRPRITIPRYVCHVTLKRFLFRLWKSKRRNPSSGHASASLNMTCLRTWTSLKAVSKQPLRRALL